MSHHFLLIIHLLSAMVWIGGHLILLITVVPKAVKSQNPSSILDFEHKFERLGMSALALLVLSGYFLAQRYGVQPSDWFAFETPVERVVSTKLALLLVTVGLALSAQLRVIPRLKAGSTRLTPIITHISLVTIIGVVMLIIGSCIRFGGIR